jgi:hypothetical protein
MQPQPDPYPTIGPLQLQNAPNLASVLMALAEAGGQTTAPFGQMNEMLLGLPGVRDMGSEVARLLGQLTSLQGIQRLSMDMIGPGQLGAIKPLNAADDVFRALPNEATEDYLDRTARHVYSDEGRRATQMRDFAQRVLDGKAQPAVRADDGRVFTRRKAAEHGDLAVRAEADDGAKFTKPGYAWRGWLMGKDFVSAEDLDPYLR